MPEQQAPEQKQGDAAPESDMMPISPDQSPDPFRLTDERKEAIGCALDSALVGVINEDDPSPECISDAQDHADSIMWLMIHYKREDWGPEDWAAVEDKIRANILLHMHELMCFCVFKKTSRELSRDSGGD